MLVERFLLIRSPQCVISQSIDPALQHAEALFVRLNPPAGTIERDSVGQWVPVTPNTTVDGGSKLMHGVDTGVRFRAVEPQEALLELTTLDAGVVVLGRPTSFPVPTDGASPWAPPDTEAYGVSAMVFDNTWGNAFAQWQPYRRDGKDVQFGGDFAFRFQLTFH